ncbi:MAG: tRNA pseudouridine(55) synthase TruB [Burkholderiaceae bacterium]
MTMLPEMHTDGSAAKVPVLLPKKQRVPVHGVLLLDKAAGGSSNEMLIRAKRLLNAEKAGHTGTLDPFATGLLPLCFGEATKFAQSLLDADKIYEAAVYLGVATTTGDTEGDVVSRASVDVTPSEIEAVLARFRGPIMQTPPMYSALKRDGKPFYEYARAGVTLERAPRALVIHTLEMLGYETPVLRLRVVCSKGTYIRVLGEDIGMALGCGAHLHALRRTGVGSLAVHDALTLKEIEGKPESERAALLAPVDALLKAYPAICLTPELARRFLDGQRISLLKEAVPPPPGGGRVRVYRGSDSMLLGTGRVQEFGVLAPERLVSKIRDLI